MQLEQSESDISEGFMDLIFDVLVPSADFDKIMLVEELVEWGGKKYSREPQKYLFTSSVYFHKDACASYYQEMLDQVLDINECVALTLEGESLFNLKFSVNNGGVDNNSCELISFIYRLFASLERFAIAILLHEEQIDVKYQTANADDAIKIIVKSLDWTCPYGPYGVLIVKNQTEIKD